MIQGKGFSAVIHYITARLHSCIISNHYKFLSTYILKTFLVCSFGSWNTISMSVPSIYDLIHDRNLIRARLNVCRAALLCLNSLDSEPIKCCLFEIWFSDRILGRIALRQDYFVLFLPTGDTYKKTLISSSKNGWQKLTLLPNYHKLHIVLRFSQYNYSSWPRKVKLWVSKSLLEI